MPLFSTYVGVDYSGAGRPDKPAPGLQVCLADTSSAPCLVTNGEEGHWTRKGLCHQLLDILYEARRQDAPVIVGIDHAFSFPIAYVEEASWPGFLRRFIGQWPTEEISVSQAVKQRPITADPTALRIAETRTVSAKSVFSFQPHGVAHSTFAGLPWLLRLKEQTGDSVHFWPFDGFEIPVGKSVVTEVYPSLFRRLFTAPSHLNEHQRDAWLVSRWLQDRDQAGLLSAYFSPPLTPSERDAVKLEGWILGVM